MQDPKEKFVLESGEIIQAFISRVQAAYGYDLSKELLYRKVLRGLTDTIRLNFLINKFPRDFDGLLVYVDMMHNFLPSSDPYWTAMIPSPDRRRSPEPPVEVGAGKRRRNGPSFSTQTGKVSSRGPFTTKTYPRLIWKMAPEPEPMSPEPVPMKSKPITADTVCFRCQGKGHIGRYCARTRVPYLKKKKPVKANYPRYPDPPRNQQK